MGDQRLSREDYKAQQALEEARKAGTAPPEVDEDGNAINPHIPQYISQAPWYLQNTRKPGLKHQRLQQRNGTQALDLWYAKGKDAQGEKVKKWKAGCCANCGATTHTTKDCLERPRKIGAKFDDSKLGRDDVITNLDLDFDSKRDRWNGFDSSQHMVLMDKYNIYEAERRKVRQQQLANKASGEKDDFDNVDDNDDHEDIHEDYREDEATTKPVSKRETATVSVRTTVRDLRIREDTAKYLLNLDVNSAYFDPKTRSLRDDPLKGIDDSEDRLYRGDNYERTKGGQVSSFAQLQLFAWEAQEKRGQPIHAQAVPSQAEAMQRQFVARREELVRAQRSAIIQKYGGEEHLDAPPKPLLLGQSEHYAEYSKTGKVVKGLERAVAKSKYDENIFPMNHTSVWGSYWENGKWGYCCCKQMLKNAYCTAKSQAADPTTKPQQQQSKPQQQQQQQVVIDAEKTAVAGIEFDTAPVEKTTKTKHKSRKGEDDSSQSAIDKQDRHNHHGKESSDLNEDSRKRKYNSMSANEVQVTEEEMEAWRKNRGHWEDPMRNMS